MKEVNDRTHYLPRLPRPYFQADAIVHWTLTMWDRAQGWLSLTFHSRFRELILHAAAREGLFCPAYCLMPDHMHFVWMGLRLDTDQLNAMAFLRTHLEHALSGYRLQPQAHDHVLRRHERERGAFMSRVMYDLLNPVRGGLVMEPGEWPYTGCVVPGYPKMHPLEDGFLDTFWGIHAKHREPACDSHVLPPLGRR